MGRLESAGVEFGSVAPPATSYLSKVGLEVYKTGEP